MFPATVVGFIASLNFTVTRVFTETLVVPSAGVISATFGGVVSGAEAVVNADENCEANALPTASVRAVVTVTEYAVPNASGVVGVIVAELFAGLYETMEGTVAEPDFSRTVEAVIVLPSIVSLKEITTVEFTGTDAAPLVGVTATTVGGVVSGAPAVENVEDVVDASAFPLASFAALLTVNV
jgi:hypothetical protein